jgi:hypothetical protein
LTDNLLTALYLVYLVAVAGFSGYLLCPACVLHALLALLLMALNPRIRATMRATEARRIIPNP